MPIGADPTFVLLHSPLVGPASWEAVRQELDLRGYHTVVPHVEDADDGTTPYGRGYADHAAEALTDLGVSEVVLVPHSGAGSLVAMVAEIAVPNVAGIVFVDATLPVDGESRLDEMAAHHPEFAAIVRAELDRGERYPAWTDASLAPLIPDAERRAALLSEVRPRGLDFFEEPLRAPSWPRPGCAYLHLSPPYAYALEEAERLGWPVERLPLGHFAPLTDPDLVAASILALCDALR